MLHQLKQYTNEETMRRNLYRNHDEKEKWGTGKGKWEYWRRKEGQERKNAISLLYSIFKITYRMSSEASSSSEDSKTSLLSRLLIAGRRWDFGVKSKASDDSGEELDSRRRSLTASTHRCSARMRKECTCGAAPLQANGS